MSDVKSLSLCQHETCKNKRFVKREGVVGSSTENAYCKLHQLCILVDEVTASGKKLCVNYIRGCRVSLELDHKFTRCPDCLLKDRTKDKERRDAAKQKVESSVLTNTVITEKTCTTCCQVYPIESFAGVKGVTTKTCVKCREDNKKQDSKRDKEHRNAVARVSEQKPARIEVKKQWKEANYEKVAETWMNSRQNRIERIGVDEYAKQNTVQAKTWRDANPEKVAKINLDVKCNINTHYKNYKCNANLKNLEFGIGFDEFCVLVRRQCHYCGELQKCGLSSKESNTICPLDKNIQQFNGIDRKDQSVGYIMTNCVSCCSMCNYMKNTLSEQVFVNKIEHILLHNNLIETGELYDELFQDIKKAEFSDYKSRSFRRQLDFMLLYEDFYKITSHNCYICGKKPSNEHKNGIDRFDNSIGYTKENCRSCCGGCNYMKRNYTYDDMMEKFQKIHRNYSSNVCENVLVTHENIILVTNPSVVTTTNIPVTDNTVVRLSENIRLVIEENPDIPEEMVNTLSENIRMAIQNTISPVEIPTNRPINTHSQNLVKTNKKTKEEVTENASLRKQKQREALKDKYGDEEYKKMRAAEITKNRADKKAKEATEEK